MAVPSRPDLCIIGAGALGVALARHARRLDADVTLIDRGRPEAGDQASVFRRLAALSASAGLAQAIRDGETLGLPRVQPKLVYRTIAERAAQVAASGDVLESAAHLRAQGITVLSGETRFDEMRTLKVGETTVRPRSIMLALGGRPAVPDVPGLDEIEVFTPDSIVENSRKLSHLLVVGGGAEAVTLAQVHRRLGCAVTLVPHGPLLAGFDRDAVAVLVEVLRAEGVEIVLDGLLAQVHPRKQGIGITLVTTDGPQALDVSHVLVATERTADIEGLGLEHLKVRTGADGSLATGALGQTGNRMVRAVGHAAGQTQWAGALAHGRAAVEAVLTGKGRTPSPPPLLVPTEPALGQMGRTDRPERPGRSASAVLRANLAENEGARASGQERGGVKLVLDAQGHVAAASVVAAGAGDLIGMLALARQAGLTLERMAELCVPYPSLANLISAMAENHVASQRVSSWTQRRRALRRLMPL